MKNILLIVFFLAYSFQAIASSSYGCDFLGRIDKIETNSPTSFQIMLHPLKRTIKTWMFGRRACKEVLGKTLSTIISSNDEGWKELNFGNSEEIAVFRICPDEARGCFWGWHSYRMNEQ